MTRGMFVRDFIAIDQPFESVAPQLLQDAAWLEPIRVRRRRRGDQHAASP